MCLQGPLGIQSGPGGVQELLEVGVGGGGGGGGKVAPVQAIKQ